MGFHVGGAGFSSMNCVKSLKLPRAAKANNYFVAHRLAVQSLRSQVIPARRFYQIISKTSSQLQQLQQKEASTPYVKGLVYQIKKKIDP